MVETSARGSIDKHKVSENAKKVNQLIRRQKTTPPAALPLPFTSAAVASQLLLRGFRPKAAVHFFDDESTLCRSWRVPPGGTALLSSGLDFAS